jgi:CheY-like chemotaxis protein
VQSANSLTELREGITAAKAGDKVSARALLRQATVLYPEEEAAWFWLAYVADNPDDRLACLRQILHINPKQAQARSVLIKALMQAAANSARSGDKSKARALLTELTDLEPQNEEAWLWRASVSSTYKDVTDCLQRVLEINPSNQRAISWLNNSRTPQTNSLAPAWNCPLCGHGATARSYRCPNCKAILTLAEMDAIVTNDEVNRSLILEAIERYRNIAGTNGNHSLHFILGLAYLNLNQTEDALTHLQKASAMQPNNQVLRHQVDSLIKRVHSNSPFRPARPGVVAEPPAAARQVSSVPAPTPPPAHVEAPTPPCPSPEHQGKVRDLHSESDSAATRGPSSAPEERQAPVRPSFPGFSDYPEETQPTPSVAQEVRSNNTITGGQPEEPGSFDAKPASFAPESSSPHIEEAAPVSDPYATGELIDPGHADHNQQHQPAPSPLDTGRLDEQPLSLRLDTAGLTTGPLERLSNVRQEDSGALPDFGAAHKQKTEKVVLVVDDSPTVRKIVAVTLERHGYRVMVASGGMEALGKINEALPDLMLLDISMPNMDGYQLCKIIKGNSLTKSVPIVMLSGKDGFFDKVRGKMSGATHYITKPFEPSALVDAVGKYCKR